MNYLHNLGAIITKDNRANGWDPIVPAYWQDPHLIATKLALIHSEISEALEAVREGGDPHGNFAEEMADTVIRILELTHGLEINLETAINEKLERNRLRGYRHGGKRL